MKIFRYKRVLVVLVALVLSVALRAQGYIFPVRNVKGNYTASYGEMRPNHFHSGVDIRTDKVTGKPVVAVADGYISRVSMSSGGYGLALYVNHPHKGTMSVYAHLSRLRKDVADYLAAERYGAKKHSLNLFPKADKFPVKQGDTIAFSGNSGSSFGPHLHYELRDVKSAYTLNPMNLGALKANDTIAPKILRLHYVVVDTLAGEPKSRLCSTYTPKFVNGRYVIESEVALSGRGYFVIESVDNRNNSANRFGIYTATTKINGKRDFEYRIDHFSFADTRHCNVVSYYPLQRTAKCEVLRLAKMPLAPDYLYRYSPTDGFVSLQRGERAEVEVVVADDSGNSSKLAFSVYGEEYLGTPMFKRDIDAILVLSNEESVVKGEGFSLSVPRKALYEPEYCCTKSVEIEAIKDSTIVQLSSFYRIFAEDTPFNKGFRASFAASTTPSDLQRHACVAYVDTKGKLRYLGGEFKNDSVVVRLRRGGDMTVVADTVAPRIKARFKAKADMRGVSEMRFSVKDNFSGIAKYKLLIDGEWRTLDLQPVQGALVHKFDRPLVGNSRYRQVELEVMDGCGNVAFWRGEILK